MVFNQHGRLISYRGYGLGGRGSHCDLRTPTSSSTAAPPEIYNIHSTKSLYHKSHCTLRSRSKANHRHPDKIGGFTYLHTSR